MVLESRITLYFWDRTLNFWPCEICQEKQKTVVKFWRRRRPALARSRDHTGRLARMRSTFAAAPLILALVFHTVAALGASSLLSKSTPRRLGEFLYCAERRVGDPRLISSLLCTSQASYLQLSWKNNRRLDRIPWRKSKRLKPSSS